MKKLFALAATLSLAACGAGGGVHLELHADGDIPATVVPTPVPKVIPTVALTFDYYGSTYTNAYPLLKSRGLVGTFFVDPYTVDNGEATTNQLSEMKANGWSIQGYTGVNMADLIYTSGPEAALSRLNSMKTIMASKGFDIVSIAPTSRAWNTRLRDLTAGIYANVRANNDTTGWQTYPIADTLYVSKGATASLSSTDTTASLNTQLDSLETGTGLWVVVVHKVGDDASPAFSIPSAAFAGFLDRLSADEKAGKVRVTTFEKAMVQ